MIEILEKDLIDIPFAWKVTNATNPEFHHAKCSFQSGMLCDCAMFHGMNATQKFYKEKLSTLLSAQRKLIEEQNSMKIKINQTELKEIPEEECVCIEMSCLQHCDKKHTHKIFSCEKCNNIKYGEISPSSTEKEDKMGWETEFYKLSFSDIDIGLQVYKLIASQIEQAEQRGYAEGTDKGYFQGREDGRFEGHNSAIDKAIAKIEEYVYEINKEGILHIREFALEIFRGVLLVLKK